MRDQYFGDRKDYVKFDLMLSVCEEGGIRKFTYVPMLSPSDDTGNGNDIRYRFVRRRDLFDFLQAQVRENRRQVRHLRDFMGSQDDIEYHPYLDMPYADDERCRHAGNKRRGYFRQIPSEAMTEALIFLDPDTGIEREQMPLEDEYVLYSDLGDLCERMSENSALAVFQWANQFVCSNEYFRDIAQRILNRCPSATYIDWIAKCPVGYILISKGTEMQARIAEVLAGHHERWDKDFIVGSLPRTGDHVAVSETVARPTPPIVCVPVNAPNAPIHTVHTDEGKEIDPRKAKGLKPRDKWEPQPDLSHTIQCQLCGKWLKSGIDAHVRSKQHEFSYAVYRLLFRGGDLPLGN